MDLKKSWAVAICVILMAIACSISMFTVPAIMVFVAVCYVIPFDATLATVIPIALFAGVAQQKVLAATGLTFAMRKKLGQGGAA